LAREECCGFRRWDALRAAGGEDRELREVVIAPDEGTTRRTLDYAEPLELGEARGERWLDRELWVSIALGGLIGALIAPLLATDLQIGTVRLLGLTSVITSIWVMALRRTATSTHTLGVESFSAAAVGTGTGLAAISLLNFWVLATLISPSTLALMAVAVFAGALIFQAVASRTLALRRRVAVVGTDDGALDLIRELENAGNGRFESVGVIADHSNGLKPGGTRFLGRTVDLIEIVRREDLELIVCSSPRQRTDTVQQLLDAGVTSIRVVDALEFSELASGRVAIRRITPSWFSDVLDIAATNYSARSKRIFDAVFAGTALVLTAPLCLAIALGVRLSGPGPVFYRQVRSGEGGKLFGMLKFRTMIPEAETGVPVWASENDPRATRIGRMLRKTRLDELPQLWNVLRGEMSLVGPRPERVEFLELLRDAVPFWTRRHLLKPGITGWAQVSLAYTDDTAGAADKLSYDLYYLKHRSLALDALIVLKTFKVVLFGTGAR
jgi:exopolysaccharide biosynthesis polyprenyl glycosylphosphotransferase